MSRFFCPRIAAVLPRPPVLLLVVLVALTSAKTTFAQRTTTTYIFDLTGSVAYDVSLNGSELTSSLASPNGVLRFSYTGNPGVVLSVARDPLSAAAISSFEASAGGEGVTLAWEIFSDEALRGCVVYRSQRDNPGRGMRVHEARYLPPSVRSLVDGTVSPATWYRYTLVLVREDGSEAAWSSRTVQSGPAWLHLDQNVPNPFNPVTSISFTLPAPLAVRLEVFDVHGRRVKTLAEGEMLPGRHRVQWDGTDSDGTPVATGTYFCRLRAGKTALSRKMLLLK